MSFKKRLCENTFNIILCVLAFILGIAGITAAGVYSRPYAWESHWQCIFVLSVICIDVLAPLWALLAGMAKIRITLIMGILVNMITIGMTSGAIGITYNFHSTHMNVEDGVFGICESEDKIQDNDCVQPPDGGDKQCGDELQGLCQNQEISFYIVMASLSGLIVIHLLSVISAVIMFYVVKRQRRKMNYGREMDNIDAKINLLRNELSDDSEYN